MSADLRRKAWEVIVLDTQTQKMRLIVNGAISLYEGEGMEIPAFLKAQNRIDLLNVLDVVVAALYWLRDDMETQE
jgi:hypothetical protein